jgi:hypothetical protein
MAVAACKGERIEQSRQALIGTRVKVTNEAHERLVPASP